MRRLIAIVMTSGILMGCGRTPVIGTPAEGQVVTIDQGITVTMADNDYINTVIDIPDISNLGGELVCQGGQYTALYCTRSFYSYGSFSGCLSNANGCVVTIRARRGTLEFTRWVTVVRTAATPMTTNP